MTNTKLLASYQNGNYLVKIYEDGTKIRITKEDKFIAFFPESIDIKITNNCDVNCKMCHELSNVNGKHANLNHPVINSLKEGMELAIGGGNPLTHPELINFLKRLKKKKIIANLTVNQKHFNLNKELLISLIKEKLIYGLGISINDEYDLEKIIIFAKEYPNVVIHVIAGIIDEKILMKLFDKDLKLLILGYKKIGRGKIYFSNAILENINYLKDNIINISKHFKIISFDNLAIEQLEMKSKISKEEYDKYYMGDDGDFTMYIDLVKEEYALSSTSLERYKLKDNIIDIFDHIKKGKYLY